MGRGEDINSMDENLFESDFVYAQEDQGSDYLDSLIEYINDNLNIPEVVESLNDWSEWKLCTSDWDSIEELSQEEKFILECEIASCIVSRALFRIRNSGAR